MFLYKDVLQIEMGSVPPVVRARTPDRLPVVLSRDEVAALLKQLTGTERLIVTLLYGSGVTLEECLELRVKDLDFDRHQIIVRRGKGQKDRVTMLPATVREALTTHLAEVRRLYEADLARGFGRVVLPFALDRKYLNAPAEWIGYEWLRASFAAYHRSPDHFVSPEVPGGESLEVEQRSGATRLRTSIGAQPRGSAVW